MCACAALYATYSTAHAHSGSVYEPSCAQCSTKESQTVNDRFTACVRCARANRVVPKRSVYKKPTTNETDKGATTAAVDDNIPVLFATKNPAQERVQSLQNSLTDNPSESRCDHDATQVFGDTFGIEKGKSAQYAANIDEEMDWEPCEDYTYFFHHLESMVMDLDVSKNF